MNDHYEPGFYGDNYEYDNGDASATTEYGSWYNVVGSASVSEDIINALGDWATEENVEAVLRHYVTEINNALPDRVSLHGDIFYGPYYPFADEWDGYPVDEDGAVDLAAIVDSVDLNAIIGQFV